MRFHLSYRKLTEVAKEKFKGKRRRMRMNNTIVKTFIGKHIDLSKVVAISDAEFIDRMGSGGFYVGFDIHIQLLDNPIRYERKFEYDEDDRSGHRPSPVYWRDGNTPLAVKRLQGQIDQLIQQWQQINT
jgi:hypothetical protein